MVAGTPDRRDRWTPGCRRPAAGRDGAGSGAKYDHSGLDRDTSANDALTFPPILNRVEPRLNRPKS